MNHPQHGHPQHGQPHPQHGRPAQYGYPQHGYPRDEYPQQHAQPQHEQGQPFATADAPEATPPAPSGPLTTFGDGTWEVGVDIAPGKYKTTGPAGPIRYYARLKTGDGSTSDGYFESMGCADWVKAD